MTPIEYTASLGPCLLNLVDQITTICHANQCPASPDSPVTLTLLYNAAPGEIIFITSVTLPDGGGK